MALRQAFGKRSTSFSLLRLSRPFQTRWMSSGTCLWCCFVDRLPPFLVLNRVRFSLVACMLSFCCVVFVIVVIRSVKGPFGTVSAPVLIPSSEPSRFVACSGTQRNGTRSLLRVVTCAHPLAVVHVAATVARCCARDTGGPDHSRHLLA